MDKLKPSMKVEEVSHDYIFISDSEEGKTERVFKHPSQMKYFAKLEDRLKRLELERDRDKIVLESTLKALGVNLNNKRTNISLMCQTLLNSKILLDSNKYHALKSVGGYIVGMTELDNIFQTKYIEQFSDLLNGCYHVVDEEIVLDEDKFNAMLGAL